MHNLNIDAFLDDEDYDEAAHMLSRFSASQRLSVEENAVLEHLLNENDTILPSLLDLPRDKKPVKFSVLSGISVFARDIGWKFNGEKVSCIVSPLGAEDLPQSYYDQISFYEEGQIHASRGSGSHVVEYIRPKLDGLPLGIIEIVGMNKFFVAIWDDTGYVIRESSSHLGHRAEMIGGKIFSRATVPDVRIGNKSYCNVNVPNYSPSAAFEVMDIYDDLNDGMILGINGFEYKLKWEPTLDLCWSSEGMRVKEGRTILPPVPGCFLEGTIMEVDLYGNLLRIRSDKTIPTSMDKYTALLSAVTVHDILDLIELLPSKGLRTAPARFIPSFLELSEEGARDEEGAISAAFYKHGYIMTPQTASAYRSSVDSTLMGVSKVVVQEFLRSDLHWDVSGCADLGRRPEYESLLNLYNAGKVSEDEMVRFVLWSDFANISRSELVDYINNGATSTTLLDRLDNGTIRHADCLAYLKKCPIPDVRTILPKDVSFILHTLIQSSMSEGFLVWHKFINAVLREGFRFKFSQIRSFLLKAGFFLLGARYKSMRYDSSAIFGSVSRDLFTPYAITFNDQALSSVREELSELSVHLTEEGVYELGDLVMAILRSSDGSRSWKIDVANIIRDHPDLQGYRAKLTSRLFYTDCPRNPNKVHACPHKNVRDDARRIVESSRKWELFRAIRRRIARGKARDKIDIATYNNLEARAQEAKVYVNDLIRLKLETKCRYSYAAFFDKLGFPDHGLVRIQLDLGLLNVKQEGPILLKL